MKRLKLAMCVFGLVVLTAGAAGAAVVDDLDSVRGIDFYSGPAAGEELLRENGFVVVPRFYHRIFGPYLEGGVPGSSRDKAKLPPFVTADSVHRTFHVLFEESLKDAESRAHAHMSEAAAAMLAALKPSADAPHPAQLAYDYFRVADSLFTSGTPPEGTDGVAQELALIHAADGIHLSPLFSYRIDYSQFKPRGFYTKTHTLQRYFRAMTWFGCAAFRLKSERESAAALCIAGAFRQSTPARAAWLKLDGFYRDLLSTCDDLTVEEYADVVKSLAPGLKGEARVAALREKAWALRDPKYNGMVLDPVQLKNWVEESKGMRFMGCRYVPDGGVLANVTDPKVPGRYFPTGLDVLAANGSARAKKHLAPNPAHTAALKRAAKELSAAKAANPDSHYVQLLDVMATLTAPPIAEAAEFAKTPAYADKNLMTASAVWASTRHAWILHAKQNAHYLCASMPEPLPGYIEPNPAFFDAMLKVTDHTLDTLGSFELEGVELFEKYREFLDRLRTLLGKQLRNEPYSKEDQTFFFNLGMTLVRLQGNETNHPFENQFPWMALVADVFTEAQSEQCLEVATGGCMPIYAIVEYQGAQYLTLGGVYSYYEFWQPIQGRLTDEAWHQQWDAGTVPPMPAWTTGFVAYETDVADVVRRLRAGEHVPEAAFIQDPELDAFLLAPRPRRIRTGRPPRNPRPPPTHRGTAHARPSETHTHRTPPDHAVVRPQEMAGGSEHRGKHLRGGV